MNTGVSDNTHAIAETTWSAGFIVTAKHPVTRYNTKVNITS